PLQPTVRRDRVEVAVVGAHINGSVRADCWRGAAADAVRASWWRMADDGRTLARELTKPEYPAQRAGVRVRAGRRRGRVPVGVHARDVDRAVLAERWRRLEGWTRLRGPQHLTFAGDRRQAALAAHGVDSAVRPKRRG